MSNLLVITYWKYNDPLIQNYTLPYLSIIQKKNPCSKIYLVTFETQKFKKQSSDNDIINIPFSYFGFGVLAMMQWCLICTSLFFRVIFNNISVIHCMGTPAGTVGCFLSLLSGKKLIIDSFEPHAEAMAENGTWSKNSLSFKLLFFFEKLQAKQAYAVIAATASMKEYAKEKYNIDIKNFYFKPACINFDFFSIQEKNESLLKKFNLTGHTITCIYAGKIGGIYLTEEIFDFVSACYSFWGDKFRMVFLPSNTTEESIQRYLIQRNIPLDICLVEIADHSQMPAYLSIADFAINPVKPVPSKKHCTSLKDGEYWAMGLPVIITKNISDDSKIIEESKIGAVINNLNSEGYLESIHTINNLLSSEKKESLRNRIRNIGKEYRSFSLAEKVYHEIYNGSHIILK